jgi:hypothetical protein
VPGNGGRHGAFAEIFVRVDVNWPDDYLIEERSLRSTFHEGALLYGRSRALSHALGSH